MVLPCTTASYSNWLPSAVDSKSVMLKYVSGRCIGGCDVYGPPLSLSDDGSVDSKPARRHVAHKAAFQSLDELSFDQVSPEFIFSDAPVVYKRRGAGCSTRGALAREAVCRVLGRARGAGPRTPGQLYVDAAYRAIFLSSCCRNQFCDREQSIAAPN